MATESVTTAGSTHGLWIGDDCVLTFDINKASREFPPSLDQCTKLNAMIQGLARAARATVYYAENAPSNADFLMQPVEDIADAILLLSQLSQAVLDETQRREVKA